MPKRQVEAPDPIEYLSILDEQGEVDADLDPHLSDDQLREFHRMMVLSRRFDERLLRLQREGKIGTFPPIRGQEAAQIGSVACLNEDDWLVPAFRETAAMIWRGISLENVFLFNAGFNEGGRIPEGKNDLPIAIPVATQIVHAAGIAYAIKYRRSGQIVLTYFGDGATSEGDFHEALNFAGVAQLPVVFVCQNNQYAISLPREKQTRSRTIAQKSIAYGFPGVQVDGNDVLAVYRATREAVDRARSGQGPTLIECVTYRLSVHTTADDPTRYRTQEEVARWEAREPLSRLQVYLRRRGILDDDLVREDEEEAGRRIDDAWKQAHGKMQHLGDPLEMFEHGTARRSPYLEEQRENFAKFLEETEGR